MRTLRRLERLVSLQHVLGFDTCYFPTEEDIDRNIYPLLLLMNLSGNKTSASCAGHTTQRLKCWGAGEGSHPDTLEGGYVNFTPRSELVVLRLKQTFRLGQEKFWDERDVWMDQKRGVGVATDIYYADGKIDCRLSWCLPYHRSQQFIQLLEALFIIEIELMRNKIEVIQKEGCE